MNQMLRFSPLRLVLCLLAASLLSLPLTAQAQKMDKAEYKKWKDMAKKYKKDPQLLKVEVETYESSINALKAQIKDLERRVEQQTASDNSEEMAQLKMRTVELENQVRRINTENGQLKEELASKNRLSRMGVPSGLVYRVQVAAFIHHNPDLPESLSTGFTVEEDDGFNKYLVGAFRTYDEAGTLRDEFKLMGIDKAWIVAYIDGQRVTMDEAQSYLSNQDGSPFFLEEN
jgi:hypothetical protein